MSEQQRVLWREERERFLAALGQLERHAERNRALMLVAYDTTGYVPVMYGLRAAGNTGLSKSAWSPEKQWRSFSCSEATLCCSKERSAGIQSALYCTMTQ